MILPFVYLCFQAEKFDGLVHSFMERLTEAERVLKYGVIPEEEEGLRAFHKQHKVSKVWHSVILFHPACLPVQVKGQGLLQSNMLVEIRIHYHHWVVWCGGYDLELEPIQPMERHNCSP